MVPPQEDGWGEGVCPICQELPKDAVSTECGHHFCRGCLARHVVKASASGVLRCPLCRKPCSEGVLGAGYLCSSHQKKVCYFCEESRLLLCGECLVSPEHQGHHELAIEDALSHYKERLSRRRRRLRRDLRALCRLRAQEEEKLWAVQAQVGCGTCRLEAELESQPQSRREQDAPLKQWPDPLENTPAPGARILDVSRATAQLRSLVAALDKTTKGLGVDTLKEARDLLDRSAPQKLEAVYPQLEKRIQPPSSPPRGQPRMSSPPPSPEREPLSSSPQLGPDARASDPGTGVTASFPSYAPAHGCPHTRQGPWPPLSLRADGGTLTMY
uniref:tripartite motif-containing protein 40 n=1 Tax=Odobenus rosmarus divergens TaxID=9708 RepID=UPI00063CD957|nr:PREDICTED: tripartite motif-containing protein 40 [Odobenus rosmarus divergens]